MNFARTVQRIELGAGLVGLCLASPQLARVICRQCRDVLGGVGGRCSADPPSLTDPPRRHRAEPSPRPLALAAGSVPCHAHIPAPTQYNIVLFEKVGVVEVLHA